MSKEKDFSNVSKYLREKRFSQKYKHTLNVKKYDGEMWNSEDIQFFALYQERTEWYDPFHRRHYYYRVSMDLFGYDYDYMNYKTVKKIGKRGTISIPAKKAAGLQNFLIQKPTDETFILPHYTGDYHLSFGKRSLFGRPELSWRFLHSKEEWDNSLFLPRKERKDVQKRFKAKEKRERFWFDDSQTRLLVTYLDLVLPYEFLT